MFNYVCGLSSSEYHSWVEDRSTATDIKMFDRPMIDGALCDLRACVPLTLLAMWCFVQSPICTLVMFVEQTLFGFVAALTLVLAEIAGGRLAAEVLPPCVHFIFIGAARKFRHTPWRANLALALVMSLLCILTGHPLGALVVLAVQYARSRR